jgi:hypothetical protein
VDERVWAVQLVEHAGTKVMNGRSSCWKKPSHGGARATPGRPTSPINGTPWCPSSAGKQLSPSPICVLKFLSSEPP